MYGPGKANEMRQGLGIFVVIIVILGMTGVAYAHWSETLHVSGTVKTGELDAKWSAGPSWDTEPPEKDASSIECYLDPEDGTGHTLIVEIKNAYPSIDYYQLIDLHNTGTIPLHVWSVDIDDGEMPDGATIEILDVDDVDVPDEFQDHVTSELDIKPCEQIHPGETAYGVIHIHLPQSAGQGTEYSFSATLITVQWNEGCWQEGDGGEGNSSDSESGSDQSGSDGHLSSGDNSEDGGRGGGNPGSSNTDQSGAGDNSDDSNSADDDRDTEATDGQSEAENNDDSSGSEENEGGESGAGGNQAAPGASGNEEGGESDTGGETGQSEQSGTESGTDDGNSGSGSNERNDLGSTGGGEEGNSETGGDGGRFSAEGDGGGSGDEGEDKSIGSGETGDGTGIAKDDDAPVVEYVGSEQGVLAAGLVAVLIVLLITVFIGFMKPRKRS